MKSILVFAAADAHAREMLAPYRLPSFLSSLRDENIEPAIVDLTASGELPVSAPLVITAALRRNRGTIKELQARRVVHTFGDVPLLASIWRNAAQAGCGVVHSVTGASNVVGRALLPKSLWAKHASRYVEAILGSNRGAIRDYIEAGFFAHAKFSMIARPPLGIAIGAEPNVQQQASIPTFGCRGHHTDGVLDFLVAALKLVGNQHLFRVLIAQTADSAAFSSRFLANISFQHLRESRNFVRCVNVLIVPKSDDRAIEDVVMALRQNKIVIAPDGGTISELLQFGRSGVLFKAGDAYALARAINNVTACWNRPPFDFRGGESVVDQVSPQQVARTFARAYQKLGHDAKAVA